MQCLKQCSTNAEELDSILVRNFPRCVCVAVIVDASLFEILNMLVKYNSIWALGTYVDRKDNLADHITRRILINLAFG